MLFEVKNGTLSRDGVEILSHFDFRMVDNEKIGVVGRNGAGKTTLLSFIMGEIGLDYNDDSSIGEANKSKDFKCGYLRQKLAGNEKVGDKGITVYNYLLSAFDNLIEMEKKISNITNELNANYDEKKAIELNDLIDLYNREGGEKYIKELKIGFKKFGFDMKDLDKEITTFSGGQTTKMSLLKLLLSKPEVLVLDEPTNHLDIDAIEWMENYLKGYKKNIIIVSHDRMFLDGICNVIYDIENKLATRYEGNYSDFVEQKDIKYKLSVAEYEKNLKEIERLTALADRFRYKATKAKMVKSKDKVIEKLEAKIVMPMESDTTSFDVKFIPRKQGGKEVFRCTDLVVGYDGKKVAAIQDFIINRMDRLAIIGANGTGKSTFIKTIVDVIPKILGDYQYGHEIEYEYFDQRIAENSSEKTLFMDFSDEFPSYTNTEVRNRLGRFLFGANDIDKRVCDLSGGEKVRLCLAKIFERRPNLLILDEPTNHLDILGKESLENIIKDYEGTVILVSHDRYFVKRVSNKILYFESDEKDKISTMFFEYGYEDYEKYVKSKETGFADDITNYDSMKMVMHKVEENVSVNKKDIVNPYNGNKEHIKNEKKLLKIEEAIMEIENDIKDYEQKLNASDIQTDFNELTRIQEIIDEKKALLDLKYQEYEEISNLL